MVKLSELDKDVKVSYNERIYTVEEVMNDLRYFTDDEDINLYTTTEHKASIDAASFIDAVFDSVYENGMYEDWDERIKQDIKEEDVKKIQAVFDEILSRNEEQNISYYECEKIEIDVPFS
jgi:hypothetical protein